VEHVSYHRPTVHPPAKLLAAQRAGSNVEVSVLGRQKTLRPMTQEMKNVRHDLVLDVLAGGGDEPFSKAGVMGSNSRLTPDFISVENKSVLELATNAISEEYSLDYEWKKKQNKYQEPCDSVGYQLMILVVSPMLIKVNFHLSQFEVNMLCFRVRLGLALESLVNEQMGQNMFAEDLTERENMVEFILKGMPYAAESSEMFDLGEITGTAEPVNPSDRAIFKEALHKTLNDATKVSKEDALTVRNYLSKFKHTECQMGKKRISNIPFVYMKSECAHQLQLDPYSSEDMPSHLKQLWDTARGTSTEILKYHEVLLEAKGDVTWDKHRIQKQCAFNAHLSEEDRRTCALSGVFGKEFSDDPEVQNHRKQSQKSFHPDVDVSDISHFVDWNSLSRAKTNVPMSIRLLIKSAKELWSKNSASHTMFTNLLHTPMMCFAQTISDLMTEVAYCYRYWPKRSDFYHKESKGVHILVRSTGSHIFTSFAFPECCSELIDPGRLGPNLYFSDNYIFTDFCSFDEPTLEHFVKSGPYAAAIAGHLLAHLELPLDCDISKEKNLQKTLNLIFLLYLNNKTDSEELITSQRYLIMGVLEELDPNPYRFTSRLPEVLRSRLTAYLLKKTLKLMFYYGENRIKKTIDSTYGKPEIKHLGILSIFSDSEISLRQQINEFYFGYVISKERGRGADRNFKIIRKIIKEEYDARLTVNKTLSRGIKKEKFVSNPIIIKVMVSIYKSQLTSLYGDQWKDVMKRQILRRLALGTFSEIATLKVASRSYKDKIIVPGILPGSTAQEIKEILCKYNPEESEKRPKVMEALSDLVAHFILAEGKSPNHIIEMLPFSYNLLQKKGYFDTDLFIKPQHGGDREIHVLEIAARICQYHLETIARAMSSMAPEDSLTHPKSKDYFVSQHHRAAEEKLGDQYFTLGKSADATKWCQRNHVSKFACFMIPLLDKLFWKFVLSILWLWLFKRMSFPVQFASNLMANQTVISDPLYMRFRKEFLEGSGLFESPKNNKMSIKFGMMQGILHFVSTLVHVIVMVSMKIIVSSYLKKKKIDHHISVISGSDDSGQLISVAGKAKLENLRLITTMLHWKDHMAEYASIYSNRAKSSVGTLDLIEYNSEWNLREHSMKPTFRWVSACLETTVVERFIDRLRTMYNTLSQVLEGGGKTAECSIIQMCQAWLHYMMLGLHNNALANDVAIKIWKTKDPSLGYFMLDSDFNSGITGVDFQLYHLVMRTGFSKIGYRVADPELLNDDEMKDSTIPDDLRSSRLPFGSLKFWHSLLRRMKVPELENIIRAVENNPLIVFENRPQWEHCKYQIFLKVFQPGVKESLSGYSPTIRMMAATSYLISKQCFSKIIRHDRSTVKLSLYQLLAAEEEQMAKRSMTSAELQKTFPYSQEYSEMLDYITHIEDKHSLRKLPLKLSSKQKILVFEKEVDEIPIIEMCRKKWNFTNHVPLSDRQFQESWLELKSKYSFVKDSLKASCEATDMNVVEIKSYLESFTTKARKIVLMDSAAKSSNIKSAVSRVFWPNVKIEMPQEDSDIDSFSLRSDVFCILSFWGSSIWKKNYIQGALNHMKLSEKPLVPHRIKKLQILSKWLNNHDKSSIVREIHKLSNGVVGYFLKAQQGFGNSRTGDGLWAGSALGVSINICMSVKEINGEMKNVCEEIVVNRIYEPKTLSKVLFDLVREFKLVKPGVFQKSMLWLTEGGRLVTGEGESNDIPIRVDDHLEVLFIDKLSEVDWDWVVTSSKIRLVASVNEDTKITIMSDDFGSRDWDPTSSSGLRGPVSLWSQSLPISLTDLQDELISAVGTSNHQVLSAIKDPSLMTRSGWSISSLVTHLKDFYIKEEQIKTADNESVMSDDVQDLLDFINLEQESDNESLMNSDLESEGGIELEPDLFELDNIDITDMKIQEDIFDALPLSRFGPYKAGWGMPRFNNFFSGLDTLSHVLFKRSFMALLEGPTVEIPGLLGIIATMITRKPWCSSGHDQMMAELVEYELSVTSLTQSLQTDADYKNLNEEQIQNAIDEIRSSMEQAGELTRPLYRQQIIRLSRALLYRRKTKEPDNLTSVTMTTFLDMIFLENNFPRKDVIRDMDEPLRVAFIRSLLQMDLGQEEKRGRITTHELNLMVEAINQSFVTTLSMDAAWRAWGVGSRTSSYVVGNGQINL
jgi:hypothetical protein